MKIERAEYINDGFIISQGGLYSIFSRAVRGKLGGFDLERVDRTTVINGSDIKIESKYNTICFVSQSKADEFEKLMIGLGVEILEASPELT
jgi:hypothetical protein